MLWDLVRAELQIMPGSTEIPGPDRARSP